MEDSNENYSLDYICKQYYNYILQICLKNLNYNESSAADVTQDTFKELCLQWDKLEKSNIRAWLKKTAEYKILQAKAKYTKSLNQLNIDTYLLNEKESIKQEEIDATIINNMINYNLEKYQDEIYSKLKENEVLLCSYIKQGLPQKEIGKKMNMNYGAVKMAIIRLRKKVKQIILEITESLI